MVSLFSVGALEEKEISFGSDGEGFPREIPDVEASSDGELLQEATNRGLQSFIPSAMFNNVISNFSIARQLYGDRMLRLLTGFSAGSLQRNLRIPEFKKELKRIMEERIQNLQDEGKLSSDGRITDEGKKLASVVLFMQELDLRGEGLRGERDAMQKGHYGDPAEVRKFLHGDRYRNIDVRNSVRCAARRLHKKIGLDDLRTRERKRKGSLAIIYGIDASASMKGDKLGMAKRAGVALAYKAISEHDKVGLVVFGSDVKDKIPPTSDFSFMLEQISKVTASQQTDFVAMIDESVRLFPGDAETKLLLCITDALPTTGVAPVDQTLVAVAKAAEAGITVSLVGIKLDEDGTRLARRIAEIGNGRLYLASSPEGVDALVLAEYERA